MCPHARKKEKLKRKLRRVSNNELIWFSHPSRRKRKHGQDERSLRNTFSFKGMIEHCVRIWGFAKKICTANVYVNVRHMYVQLKCVSGCDTRFEVSSLSLFSRLALIGQFDRNWLQVRRMYSDIWYGFLIPTTFYIAPALVSLPSNSQGKTPHLLEDERYWGRYLMPEHDIETGVLQLDINTKRDISTLNVCVGEFNASKS